MSYELIITEKPSAAEKIAHALADLKPDKKREGQVSYYEITHNKKPIIVACAVGHLYTVTEKEKSKGWTYPIFDLKWEQSSKVNKGSAFTSKYVSVIKKLAKDANEFTVATDYDIEGEVIGLMCVQFACKQKDANRMKFSTLTKPDLIKAYQQKAKTLNWGQALAGKTRHELDWYYGINLSRALSLAIRSAGQFKILSSGRVQGPALKILVDKEKEISAFVSEPYWQIELYSKKNNQEIIALYTEEKVFDKEKAQNVYQTCKDAKEAIVQDVQTTQFKQQPPTPFDLTSLQVENHRVHKITPKVTLSLAQDLYINGFISYPRTSSQKLPKEIGYTKILKELSRQSQYMELTNKLLAQKTLKPNEGKKTDDAHPAIYPTGLVPQKLTAQHLKLYDLIVRRFLAVFGEPATRERMSAKLEANTISFLTKGVHTVEKGWHEYYGKFAMFEETTLPDLTVGEKLPVVKIEKQEKQTKPPKRYTASSIIKELEKQNLGTKATRSAIVENLYDRGYVNEKSIQATDIGIKTCDILQQYCPKIIDPALTRQFEDEMEDIRTQKTTPQKVLDHSKEILSDILTDFKKKEKDIGKALLNATRETVEQLTTIGPCPVCKEGTLKIKRGKFGEFIACDNYPDCKSTYSIPKGVKAKPTEQVSEQGDPIVEFVKARSKPEMVTLTAQMLGSKKVEKLKKKCPTCKTGDLLKRSSYRGEFIGCSNYPKCTYTEQIAVEKKKDE
ncbi:MAG: DNA topoisomerase I [Candidatus Woesearchaeota archaeon]